MRKMMRWMIGMGSSMMLVGAAWAGNAETSASAGNGWRGEGTASATARYEGQDGQGFARTRTVTGDINRARAVAVGVDRDGMDISVSHALAGRFGILPAYARTFNLSIGRDGSVAVSRGSGFVEGGRVQEVHAGGHATSDGFGARSGAQAGGSALPDGVVNAETRSWSRPGTARCQAGRSVVIVRR